MADPALNIANRTLYHGDNLPFLRGINSGTIHLIATDPPFNKGRDFHATPDSLAAGARFEDRWSWDRDVHEDWVDAIQDDWPAVWQVIEAARSAAGDDMAAYLCWLGVRLLEMHRVLRDDGSIYLHIDHTAHAWVKALMDAIFGRKNFRNEIVWHYLGGALTGVRSVYPRKHDTILFYSRGDNWTFNQPRGNDISDQMRRRWGQYLEKDGATVLYGSIKHERGEEARSRRRIERDLGRPPEDGDVAFVVRPSLVRSVWTDIPEVRNNPRYRESVGYPTQKPLALYERIIRASSNEGDFVLDPFCGCATTLVAAERLDRQWVGIDIWDKAHDTVIQRLQAEQLMGPDGDANGHLLTFGQIDYTTTLPERTDDKATAAPPLVLKMQVPEPEGRKMTRQEMVDFLLINEGHVCAGCDRQFDDPRYLELDHKIPRSEGGFNHISNRMLLCGPCNRIKSNRLTLGGLRAENRRLGRMYRG